MKLRTFLTSAVAAAAALAFAAPAATSSTEAAAALARTAISSSRAKKLELTGFLENSDQWIARATASTVGAFSHCRVPPRERSLAGALPRGRVDVGGAR